MKTTIYAIFNDYSYKLFDRINSEIYCEYWLKVFDYGNTYTTNTPKTYKLYEYGFFDSNNQPIKLTLNKWKVTEMTDGDMQHAFDAGPFIYISDPKGEIRIKKFRGWNITGIILGIKFFKEVCNYSNWAEYELKEENKKLKVENQSLKEEIDRLKDTSEEL